MRYEPIYKVHVDYKTLESRIDRAHSRSEFWAWFLVTAMLGFGLLAFLNWWLS